MDTTRQWQCSDRTRSQLLVCRSQSQLFVLTPKMLQGRGTDASVLVMRGCRVLTCAVPLF